MLTLPVYTVAAVNGHAFGAGAQLAVAHDLRLMRTDRGFFCTPEIDMKVGLHQEEIARRGWSITAAAALGLVGRPETALIDLREKSERDKHGYIAGSVHAPYPELQENVAPGGLVRELATATGKRIIFYCAFGERSAMAVQAAQDAGVTSACHIEGGIAAWKKAGGPLTS